MRNENANYGLMSKYDVFVFDWDGTLASLKTIRALNEKLNPHWNYKKKKELQTKKGDVNFDVYKGTWGKRNERSLLTKIGDIYLFFIRPKLHNDSIEVLKTLREKKKTVVLLTNGGEWRIMKEISILNVGKYFDMIISTQQLHALKPNPLALELIIKSLKAKKDKVLYIGDMDDDIFMAKYAKVNSCGLSCGMDSHSMLRAARPTYLFRSVEELKKAL
ncbi:MAG: HAD family hydrolase [Candidatus Marsarchaeota archaeon]|nr:HAD family hydrolase [Candidatus Marsarchaeota archaeon]